MQEGDVSPTVLDEPYPCEDCKHQKTCARFEISCKSFHIYVNNKGRLDKRFRHPTLKWFYRTFHKQRKSPDAREQPIRFVTAAGAGVSHQ